MVIRKLLAGLIAFLSLSTTAYAEPHLTGPLIQSLNTDKATYSFGETAQMTVTFKNTSGSDYTGNLVVTMYGRGVKIGNPITTSVPTVKQGATASVVIPIPLSQNSKWQGYYVDVSAQDNTGKELDRQATALDESPDWVVYPRQCWGVGAYTSWGGWKPPLFKGPKTDIHSLNAYHCNNIQIYNVLRRWHNPYNGQETYDNGDGQTISQALIRQQVTTAHAHRMGTYAYMPAYSANTGVAPDFTKDYSGAKLEWGAFKNNCGATKSCTVADLWNSSFDKIGVMNLNNKDWQVYWTTQAVRWMSAMGFDGMFADTYGTIMQALWDWWGNRLINDTMYSSFLSTYRALTPKRIIMNPAGAYGEEDMVRANIEDYHFNERWNNPTDVDNFGTFSDIAFNVWDWSRRIPNALGLDWDMGMNKNRMSDGACDFNGGSQKCYFNLPGVLYQEAAILATGAHHAWIVDGEMADGNGARFISNDDFPIGNMLTPSSDMVQAEFDYQSFGVAYEKLLRSNIARPYLKDPALPQNAGALVGSTTAAVGQLWLHQVHRSGFDILHILNHSTLSQISFKDVNDNTSTAAAPTKISSFAVKMYVTGPAKLGTLYTATPDKDHGRAMTLSYTTGSDSRGTYITFQAPDLLYWRMFWIENNLDTSDYATP